MIDPIGRRHALQRYFAYAYLMYREAAAGENCVRELSAKL